MLVRIQETPMWEDDLVQWLEILGRRRATPGWEEDPVRWLSQGLEYQGRQGIGT